MTETDPQSGGTLSNTPEPRAWLDVTDLVNFIADSRSVTGIQRVVSMLLLEIEAGSSQTDSSERAGRCDIRACYYDFDFRVYVDEPLDLFKAKLRAYLAGQYISPRREIPRIPSSLSKTLISFIPKAFRPRRFIVRPPTYEPRPDQLCSFHPGDIFVLVGAFWFRPAYFEVIMRTAESAGMRMGIVVYDLIPIRFSRWFSDDYVAQLSGMWDRLLRRAELALVISNYAATDVRKFCNERSIVVPRISVFRLGDNTFPETRTSAVASPDRFMRFLDPGYILCVGSVDQRKNQQMLMRVWQRLFENYRTKTPYLILIGKVLPQSSYADAVSNCGAVGDRIVHFDDVEDAELVEFYGHCSLTVFPSYVEGWGLPVAESVAAGKLCLASNASAIPEIAGDLIEYFDPGDEDRCYRLIEMYYFDADLRDRAERRIRENYHKTTWAQSARSVTAAICEALCRRPAADAKSEGSVRA